VLFEKECICDAHLLNELSALRWCRRGVGR